MSFENIFKVINIGVFIINLILHKEVLLYLHASDTLLFKKNKKPKKATPVFSMFVSSTIILWLSALISLLINFGITWFLLSSTFAIVPMLLLLLIVPNKESLIKYLSKETNEPQAVVAYKIDAFDLCSDVPNYLKKYTVPTDKEFKYKLEVLAMQLNLPKNDLYSEYLPLYKALRLFVNTIQSDAGDLGTARVDEFLALKIPVLVTSMTILKDKELVKALESDVGRNELIDLTSELVGINLELKAIVNGIKNHNDILDKSKKTLSSVDKLNEIRSMKEMGRSVK